MSSIIIASVPIHGHVTPLLAIAAQLVDRGDDVRFITGRHFADRVRATGASFIPLLPEADYDVQTLLDGLPERAKLKGATAIAFDIDHIFARPARAQYETVIAAIDAHPADALLADPVFAGAAFMLEHPRATRPAVVMCGVLPLSIVSHDTAPFGMGLRPARVFNRQRNAALAALNRRVMRQPIQTTNDLHREVHGTDLPFALQDWSRHAEAIVQLSVAAFEYPLSDAPPQLHFAGPLSATGSQAPLPEWWSDLDGSRPVVHVTQGTVANLDYEELIAPTLRALAGEDVLVVLATGGRPLDTLPPLPANARAATFLPYDHLLPRTSVFVTNGGYGGVQYALRYGVPIVATGGKEDKPEVGARIAWSGVGRRIRTDHPTPRALRRAVRTVLEDPRYRQASQRIAADMANAPGFSGLADVVDRVIAENPSATQSPCPPTQPA
jgi:MGT family glycosyltransferase